MEKWFIKNRKPLFTPKLLEGKVHPVILKILFNREIGSEEEAIAFLSPDLALLPLPSTLPFVEEAGDMVLEAVEKGEPIYIVGDYDVDGTMGTYILTDFLSSVSAEVHYRIPHRVNEGYGLHKKHVQEAVVEEAKLLITCDQGIVAFDEIGYAKKMGLKVIVSDHHEPKQVNGLMVLPEADVIVNPKRNDFPYRNKEICGAYVAYKIAEYIALKLGIPRAVFQKAYLPFAALATVCDVMDLVGENRTIVFHGLREFESLGHIGMDALFEVTGLKKGPLSVYGAGFVIGPTINAAGRLSDANEVVRLMLTQDRDEAISIALTLHEFNRGRIALTDEATKDAFGMVEEGGLSKDPFIILHMPDIHESIAGIVAGKVKDKYYRPTIILSGQGEVLKGSGRSIPGVSLFESLAKSSDYILKFGGHELAAGLSVDRDKLDGLISCMNDQWDVNSEVFYPKFYAECEMPFYAVNFSMAKAIDDLNPFGKGNPTPIFARKNVELLSLKIMGRTGRAARLRLKDRTTVIEAVYFGDVDSFLQHIVVKYDKIAKESLLRAEGENIFLDVLFKIGLNEFRGQVNEQLVITNYR